jgi:hypothetical protein
VLLGVILLPETIEDCFPDPCPHHTQSFWDSGYVPLTLIFLGFYLLWGLFFVLIGVAFTQDVLKTRRPSAREPASFR